MCSITHSSNALSGCSISTLTGYGGARAPVALTVKSGVAFVANRNSACGVIACTSAAAMTGCSCALTAAQDAINVRGIALSPDGSKLYFTSETGGAGSGAYSIVTCAMSGTTIGACSVSSATSTDTLNGLHATNTALFVMTTYTGVGQPYGRAWVCDPTTPDPSTCVQTGSIYGTGPASDPLGLSVFDGLAYVPDDTAVRQCSDLTSVASCTASAGIDVVPVLAGAKDIFIQPRV